MESQRRKFVILIVVVSLITFGWITVGTGAEEVPYVSIEKLLEKQGTWKQDRFRLGGLVEEGSIAYSSDRLHVDFTMFQDDDRLTVRYAGLTPDMFRDGAEVIIEGRIEGEVFLADNLMTKCASRYEVDLTYPDASPHEDL
ncbi:MAG: cytochrome c maturation protein CcmE [Candidatus Marinimicrobia bacterium]|nr:cytochrome c maturation protein CcmE [Candidatus Neomarinimicrobiota bacterium]